MIGCSNDLPETTPPINNQDKPVTDTTLPWFEDVAHQVGVDFEYYSGSAGNFYIIETMGGGAALLDFDRDGDLDLYLTQGNVLEGELDPAYTDKLYENDGQGLFSDVTQESGIRETSYSIGVATGDYNNDGFVDIYVTNLGRNTLLKNNQDGTFSDVTIEAGVGGDAFSACASFFDSDNDGDLDLFITNYLDWLPEDEIQCFSEANRRDYCNPIAYDAPISDTLYENLGDGKFVDISSSCGIESSQGTGLGIGVGDINEDGLNDIFVANDGMNDSLWINQGNNQYVDEALIYGCAVDNTGKMKASMGVEFADIDNDSDLDLYVSTLFRETDSLFVNQDGVLSDSTARLGLAADTRTLTGWAVLFADFNNDSLLDLYEATGRVRWQADQFTEDCLAEPNLLFENTGTRFSLVEPLGGTAKPLLFSAHGASVGDINRDGQIDVIVVNKDAPTNVLLNTGYSGQLNNWIAFDVRDEHGAPAIGATIQLTLKTGEVYYKSIQSSSGYASSNSPHPHFGLGSNSEGVKATVYWTDRSKSTLHDVSPNTLHRIDKIK